MKDSRVLSIVAAVLCTSGTVFGVLSGDGTEEHPYLIQSRADFDEFADPSNAALYWVAGKYTKLMCNLNLSGTIYTQAVIAPDTDNVTSGFQGTRYAGVFDGNSHAIANLTITAPLKYYIGLFGYIGSWGQIKNIGVVNAEIRGYYHVGGLVGYTYRGTILSCYVTGEIVGTSAGGLMGYSDYGTISSCYTTGTVSGTGIYVGGLVGNNFYGTLTSCYATCSVRSTSSYVGGLVGYTKDGTISSCYATGEVSGIEDVGGLAGCSYSNTITSCYATGTVSGAGSSVGGLVGYSFSNTITSCYANSAVNGTNSNVGGLVGYCRDNTTITFCYATGAIIGSSFVGGLVGYGSYTYISFCYATGAITGSSYLGGLMGYADHGWISSCFWDIETSGTATSAGGIGKTIAQMKNMQTYLDTAWSFVYGNRTLGEWVMPENGYPKLAWEVYTPVKIPQLKGLTEQEAIDAINAVGLLYGESYSVYDISVTVGSVSETFPKSQTTVYAGLTPVHVLLAKETKYAGGDGVLEPYRIETVDHVLDMINTSTDWNKSFILTSDIDLKGLSFTQAPIAPDVDASSGGFQGTKFTGLFDGNSHTISNVTIFGATKNYVGFFGYLGTSGQVAGLGIKNAIVQGESYVGGLVGYCHDNATITFCYSTGVVSGKGASVGGLVGDSYSSTITFCYATCRTVSGKGASLGGLLGFSYYDVITSCYATGAVSGVNSVGGLVGSSSSSTITSCYATGAVSGGDSVGGLVGYNNQGKFIRCYSTGKPTGKSFVGGLCGYVVTGGNYASTYNFWDRESSGITTSAMGTGKTKTSMQTLSTFTSAPANWDFSVTDGDAADWMMLRETEDYPRLAWQEVFAGDIAGLYGVDGDDLMEVVNHWLEQGCPSGCEQADIDGSGAVDLGDFAVLAGEWMKGS